MSNKRIYISGPISGLGREYYMRIFAERERQLRLVHGCEVVNPTRLLPCRRLWVYRLMEGLLGRRLCYRLVMWYDLLQLRRCTHISVLAGSELSRGARLERLKAREYGIELMK